MQRNRQMDMIYLMTERLKNEVMKNEIAAREYDLPHRSTKIRRQILEIRQALLELDKCFR